MGTAPTNDAEQPSLGLTDLQRTVRQFIAEDLVGGREVVGCWTDQTPLIGPILDSISIMKLMTFIEVTYGIAVEVADVTPANFNTVEAVAKFILERLERAQGHG